MELVLVGPVSYNSLDSSFDSCPDVDYSPEAQVIRALHTNPDQIEHVINHEMTLQQSARLYKDFNLVSEALAAGDETLRLLFQYFPKKWMRWFLYQDGMSLLVWAVTKLDKDQARAVMAACPADLMRLMFEFNEKQLFGISIYELDNIEMVRLIEICPDAHLKELVHAFFEYMMSDSKPMFEADVIQAILGTIPESLIPEFFGTDSLGQTLF